MEFEGQPVMKILLYGGYSIMGTNGQWELLACILLHNLLMKNEDRKNKQKNGRY